MDILKRLAEEFNIKHRQVENTVALIDEGNTIPFISRYRKEATGELDDQLLRELNDRLIYLRSVEQRKEEVKRLIEEQDKLTPELEAKIDAAQKLAEIEDIYRPYKQKRRTRATIAKEKGLEPLADLIIAQHLFEGNIDEVCANYIDAEKGVNSTDEAIAGAMDIIAENISDNADYRKYIREYTMLNGVISSKATGKEETERNRDVYQIYHDFSEPINKIAHHRVLALNRGEREGFLSVKIDADTDSITDYLYSVLIPKKRSITSEYVELAACDSYKRLIQPSIENEIRNLLTDDSQEGAIKLFSQNLKNLLLSPPIKDKVVLGLDPAYRTGCKIAVINSTGRVLDTAIIYPTPPQNKTEEAKAILKNLISKHNVDLISIGNGTASKESEIFIAQLLKELDRKVFYLVVSESGASVYSASKLAAEEFPEYDVSLRSAVSIARRVQDPLAELVKIDPKAIGVGQYQHDMNQKRLGEALGGVVEDCVNSVGVDLNTASSSLLSYVSGINAVISKNIIAYREEKGRFSNRKQLTKVPKLGKKAFEQCAGFLRITDGDNILDNTAVHPESYNAAKKLLEITGYCPEDIKVNNLVGLSEKVMDNLTEVAQQCNVGVPTLRDITNELLKPGRDPRSEAEPPKLLADVMGIEDLKPGMVLTGTVRNVIDFGAFVDIGVHQDGLVHISQLADKYVKHPMDIVAVGDVVNVRVVEIDIDRNRISLSMRDV
ncbi:MAG: RNA-binding transcriptional accessory protein [Clostridiaceae bacterium]|nr:RNA-binding transcriptional accessory protein [Clostridiaceae bacterium]